MYKALKTDEVTAFRKGAPDAHGVPPERGVSEGSGYPCRHCLKNIPEGQDMLILAYCPFDGRHPYAEVGPIFLCAQDCVQGDSVDVPDVLRVSPNYLVRGYSVDERIIYGTGEITAQTALEAKITALFERPEVAFAHIRSASNNCLLVRVERD